MSTLIDIQWAYMLICVHTSCRGGIMSLINCPECQREISDSAKSCPNCGYIIRKATIKQRRKSVIRIIKYIFIAIVISATIFGIVYVVNRSNELHATYNEMVQEVNQQNEEYQRNKTEIDSLALELNSVEEDSEEYYKIRAKLKKLIPSLFSDEKNGFTHGKDYLFKMIDMLSALNESSKNG